MLGNANRIYYYLRSGFIHRTERVVTDKAVRLTENEAERLKAQITADPERKFDILKDFWSFLTHTKGEKPIDFTAWLDAHCEEKRRAGERRK